MSAGQYALIFTVLPFLFGAAAVWAHRQGGARRLWAAWAIAALFYSVLGYIDWRAPPDEGTPLAFYLTVATVPTAAGAWVAAWSAANRIPLVMRILLAGSACWITIFPVILLFMALTR